MIKIEVEFESIEPGAKGVLRVDGQRSIPVELAETPEEVLREGARIMRERIDADIIARYSKPPTES